MFRRWSGPGPARRLARPGIVGVAQPDGVPVLTVTGGVFFSFSDKAPSPKSDASPHRERRSHLLSPEESESQFGSFSRL